MGKNIIQRTTNIVILTALSKYATVYVFNVGLARLLSAEDYGDYKVAETFISLASIPVLMGGAGAALTFLPNAAQESKLELIWEYTRFYLITILVLSIILALTTLCISTYFFDDSSFAHHHPMVYAAGLVPIMAITILIGSIFQSNNLIYMAILPRWICYPILKLILAIAMYLVIGKVTDSLAIMTTFLALLFILFYLLLKVKALGLLQFKPIKNPTSPLVWLKVSIPIMMILLLQRVFHQVDIYMIEIYGSENGVGHYAAAQITSSVLLVIQSSLMIIYSPLMTPAVKNGVDAVRKLNTTGFRNILLFSVPSSLFLFIFPEATLSVFGHDEPEAIKTLQILVPGYFFCVLYAMPYSWLQYSGREKAVTIVMLMSLLLSIFLNFLLIPEYGIKGAALATSCMFFLTFITLTLMLKKHLGFYPWSDVWKGKGKGK